MGHRCPSAATGAKELLHSASRMLQTADPTELVSGYLDESLHLPAGHHVYRARRHVFEPSFSETAAGSLSFGMAIGDPESTGADRLQAATGAVRELVRRNFGSGALGWLDSRTEPARDPYLRNNGADAWLFSGYDRGGMREATITYAWGPTLLDTLPGPVYQVARACMDALPGLVPAFSTIRAGRSSGSQQITFGVGRALALAALRPLLDRLGLGHQHASLVGTCGFLLGARFVLPPDTALITIRATRAGIEFRLDIDLEMLGDLPPEVGSLLQLQLAERPRSVRALERWVAAFTADGEPTPGSLSVLSVVIRPDLPARVALYLRPTILDDRDDGRTADGRGDPAVRQPVELAGAGR